MRGMWAAMLLTACSGSSLPEYEVAEGSPEHQQLLQQRCDVGDATACESLGAQVLSGGDHARARVLFKRACDGLSATGCHSLGQALDDERGGVVDATGATAAFLLGCEGGHGPACTALGSRYLGGWGAPADLALARKAWEKGCALGEAACCDEVARLKP